MRYLLLTVGLLFYVESSFSASLAPVETSAYVDLHQYLGAWYEFAAIPQSFEKQCTGNTNAEYSESNNGLIAVINSCDTSSGKRSVSSGRAKVVDQVSNSKLKVTFVHFLGWQFLFGGYYWILAVGDNYSYAVVGAPGRDYAWILSREPYMTKSQIDEVNQVLLKQGFDTCKLITTIQASGMQEKLPFCQIVSGR